MRMIAGISLLSALGLIGSVQASEPERAVLQDLRAKGVQTHEAEAMSTVVCHELAAEKRFSVLCGDDLRALLKWNAMAASLETCNDDSCFNAAGKAAKARYVVAGEVAKIGQTFHLSLTLFDVKKGEPEARSSVKASSLEDLEEQVKEAVSGLKKKS